MSAENYNRFNDPRNWMPNYDFGPNLRGAGAQFAKDSFDYMAGMAAGMGRKSYRSRARWAFKGRTGTKVRRKSVARQNTISAPMARRIDTKYSDYTAVISGLKNTAPQSWSISNIAQGATEGQRIGNDVRFLKFIISLEIAHGSTLEDQTFRFVLYYDKTGNSNAAIAASNLFNTDGGGNVTPQSLRNVTNLEDYVLLLDKLIYVPLHHGTNHGRKILQFEIKTSIGQRYSGAAGTTVVKNPIHAMILTNLPNTTTGATGYLAIRQIYSDVC